MISRMQDLPQQNHYIQSKILMPMSLTQVTLTSNSTTIFPPRISSMKIMAHSSLIKQRTPQLVEYLPQIRAPRKICLHSIKLSTPKVPRSFSAINTFLASCSLKACCSLTIYYRLTTTVRWQSSCRSTRSCYDAGRHCGESQLHRRESCYST